jgi:hypothetical protein
MEWASRFVAPLELCFVFLISVIALGGQNCTGCFLDGENAYGTVMCDGDGKGKLIERAFCAIGAVNFLSMCSKNLLMLYCNLSQFYLK